MRTFWRRLWLALATITGLGERGYFMPYRYAGTVGRRDREGYPALAPMFEAAEDTFCQLVGIIDGYADPLTGFDGPPPEPRWTQNWFPGLDGAAMYAIIRHRRPGRIVEIGSGHSTRFMVRAIGDGGFRCAVSAVDPAPRADIAELDLIAVRVPLQQAPAGLFDGFAAGDVVSVDSSHLVVAGSDVDILVNDVLPRLPSGTLIQIHDVFLPDSYPVQWAWREYNEQSVIAPLVHGGRYRLVWSSHWVRTRLADALHGPVCGHLQPPDGAVESSLWLEKR